MGSSVLSITECPPLGLSCSLSCAKHRCTEHQHVETVQKSPLALLEEQLNTSQVYWVLSAWQEASGQAWCLTTSQPTTTTPPQTGCLTHWGRITSSGLWQTYPWATMVG